MTAYALVQYSSVGDEAAFLAVFRAHGVQITPFAVCARPYETLTLYHLSGRRELRITP